MQIFKRLFPNLFLNKTKNLTDYILNINMFTPLTIEVIDSILKNQYKHIHIPVELYQAKMIREALENTQKHNLSKIQKINIAIIRDSVNERYDENYNIRKDSRTFQQLFSAIPKNVKPLCIEELEELNNRMSNYKDLKNNYLKSYPDDEAISFIASPNEEERCNKCHELHGTIWENKNEVPEWAKPPLHRDCTCKLLLHSDITDKIFQVDGERIGRKCVSPIWLKSMQGISNIKKVKGVCCYTYRTIIKK